MYCKISLSLELCLKGTNIRRGLPNSLFGVQAMILRFVYKRISLPLALWWSIGISHGLASKIVLSTFWSKEIQVH
jgi:hypothetical protein